MKRLSIVWLCLLALCLSASAIQHPLRPLHVDGRHFRDASGNAVVLHGFGQTYSPWFNEQFTKWSGYDPKPCLDYNQGLIDRIVAAGWQTDFVRLHMDPYWSNTPGQKTQGEADISAFSMERFKKYLDEVFVLMARYIMSKGMYVVMRPPGVCPQTISEGDAYQRYLIQVWSHVAAHPALKDNPGVLYELANEPVSIVDAQGRKADPGAMTRWIQPVVDAVRAHCNNIVLVPGLGYQSHYADFAKYPVQGYNVGYAVHCYPGWYNGAHNQDEEVKVDYESFRAGWQAEISPIAAIAPVMVTEMDWAPVKYKASWGKSTTGTVGGTGFGANFKKIADDEGNVSWMIFTGPEILARYDGVPAGEAGATIINDPEACVWPAYHWFEDYARTQYAADAPYGSTLSRGRVVRIETERSRYSLMPSSRQPVNVLAVYEDGSRENVSAQSEFSSTSAAVRMDRWAMEGMTDGEATVEATYRTPDGRMLTASAAVEVTAFPLHGGALDPSIWEKGTFDEATGTLHTGRWGFGGWRYAGLDLSAYEYLVVELAGPQSCAASFRLFDENNYWSKPAMYDFGSQTRLVIDLRHMVKSGTTQPCDPSHIYIAGLWTNGSSPVSIKRIYLSHDGLTPTAIGSVPLAPARRGGRVYGLDGRLLRTDGRLADLPHGIYIMDGRKVVR